MAWLLPIASFLIGSIPFGLLIAKSKGVDIRSHGSGNIGATNVLRVIGKGPGITCLVLDLLKGFIPVVIAINLLRFGDDLPMKYLQVPALINLTDPFPASSQFKVQLIHILTALFAILGHNYSPWIGFKGGKGIATTAGAFLGLLPFATLLLILIWVVVLVLTRYVSVASITAGIFLPVLTHLGTRYHRVDDSDETSPTLWESGTWNKPLFFFALFAGLMAVWKHRSNVTRLREGTENRIFSKKTKTT